MFCFPLTINGAITKENISKMNEWNINFPLAPVSSHPTSNPLHAFKSYLTVKLQAPLQYMLLLRYFGYRYPSDFGCFVHMNSC